MRYLLDQEGARRLVGNDQALDHLQSSGTKADMVNGAQLSVFKEGGLTAYLLEGTEEQIRTVFDHLGGPATSKNFPTRNHVAIVWFGEGLSARLAVKFVHGSTPQEAEKEIRKDNPNLFEVNQVLDMSAQEPAVQKMFESFEQHHSPDDLSPEAKRALEQMLSFILIFGLREGEESMALSIARSGQ